MNIYEFVFGILFSADLIWATLVGLYVLIGLPITYLIIRVRDKKRGKRK